MNLMHEAGVKRKYCVCMLMDWMIDWLIGRVQITCIVIKTPRHESRDHLYATTHIDETPLETTCLYTRSVHLTLAIMWDDNRYTVNTTLTIGIVLIRGPVSIAVSPDCSSCTMLYSADVSLLRVDRDYIYDCISMSASVPIQLSGVHAVPLPTADLVLMLTYWYGLDQLSVHQPSSKKVPDVLRATYTAKCVFVNLTWRHSLLAAIRLLLSSLATM